MSPSRWIAVMDALEDRLLLTAVEPTAYDQYMLELINRARANPAVEAARYGIDLNEGVAANQAITTTPKQPLVFDPYLIDAATGHSQDMITAGFFSHDSSDGSGDPLAPWETRMTNAGYVFDTTNGYASGENIAWTGTYPAVPPLDTTTAQLHQDLFVDAGYDGRGHRINMLIGEFKEIGVGMVPGVFNPDGTDYNALMATTDFAFNAGTVFLTGVAYDDINGDKFYEPGEGIGGLTITAVRKSDGKTFTTTNFDSGGYTIPIEPGTYTVTASGANLKDGTKTWPYPVVIGQDNKKVDFIAVSSQGATQITGHAYYDLNHDGSFTAGEGLGGLTVNAAPSAGGAAVATQTTAADGSYTLDVPRGIYNVTVSGASLNAPITTRGISVVAGTTTVDLLKPPANISGRVYDDLNYSHAYNAGEGLDGLTVSAAPASGGAAVETTTANGGAYTLSVDPGIYTLTVSGDALAVPLVLQNIDVSQHDKSGADVVKTPARVSGMIYDDLDYDGAYTAGEGLAGLAVAAVRTAGGTCPTQTATTAADGTYTLPLEPGTYTLTVTGAALDAPLVKTGVAVAALDQGNINFLKPAPTITGVVYSDLNQDGSYTPGEPVFKGVIITATPAVGTPIYAATDANGYYSMPDIMSGTYTLTASGGGLTAPLTIPNVVVARHNVKQNFIKPQIQTGPTPDKTPPTAKFTGTKSVTTVATSYKFTVTYTDQSKVKRASIGTGDITISGGPKTFKAIKPTFVSTPAKVDATSIVATYSFVPQGGKWTYALNGTYTVTLNANRVADAKNNKLAKSLVLGTFTVTLKKIVVKKAASPLNSLFVAGNPPAGLFADSPIHRATADIF